MPLPLGTAINPTLIGFLEKGLVDQAAATFARNPVAARQILGQALVALFEPPVGTLIVAACLATAAAYLLSQYGQDPPLPTPDPSQSRTWKAPTGSNLAVFGTSPNTGDLTITGCPSTVIEASDLQDNPEFPGNPIYVKLKTNSGSFVYTSSGGGQPLRITSCEVCPGTANPPGIIDPVGPEYPPLTDDDVPLLTGLVTGLIPGNKKAPPPNLQPQLQPILDGLDDLAKKVADCCKEDKDKFAEVLAEIDKILKRVKKVSSNIGLPDIDGTNYGNIFGPFDASTNTLAEAINDSWRAIGKYGSNEVIQEGGVDRPNSSVYESFLGMYRRTGYFVPSIKAGVNGEDIPIKSVQAHIQLIECEGADASFNLGYPDSGPKSSVIKVIFTDLSKFKRRQNASITIVNPSPNLTKEQVRAAFPNRILGNFWCVIRCDDNSKISGWFVSESDGLLALTRAAQLNASGPTNPVQFTATKKNFGIPALAGIVLNATGYVWHQKQQDGNYKLTHEKL